MLLLSFLLNLTPLPYFSGTLKYEFTGRPTDGRVDEAMVALMDELDCTAALVGQFEMTIVTDDKPWNKDVKSEIWVTKTPQIEACLRRQKDKDNDVVVDDDDDGDDDHKNKAS